MVDVALLAGRLLLLALLYLFLFAAVRTGVGLVASRGHGVPGTLALRVIRGPRGLRNASVPIGGPVVIGRSPGADIVIGDDFVSSRHARVYPSGGDVFIEDLGSTNGTLVNGERIVGPTRLSAGDSIEVGSVRLEVARA